MVGASVASTGTRRAGCLRGSMVSGSVGGWRPPSALDGGSRGCGSGGSRPRCRGGGTSRPQGWSWSCRCHDHARRLHPGRTLVWAAAAAAAAAATLVLSVAAGGNAGEAAAAAVAGEGLSPAAPSALPFVFRWAASLRHPTAPSARAPRPVARQGVAADGGAASRQVVAGGAGTSTLSANGVPGGTPTPLPEPSVIPYSLESVHKPHFLASANKSSCSASSVTSVAHVPVPNRPGVFFIPHSLIRMDGSVCSATRAPSPPFTDAQVEELLAGPGTLVTRRRNVATEAAAIAAGVEDMWALLSPLQNAMVILDHFTYVDLWVGVERDDPRVCGLPRMAIGSVFFWLRMLSDDSLSIPSIGLELEANATAVFGVNAEGQRICVWSRTDADTYVPTPPPAVAPAAEPNLGYRSCFPSTATVTRADGSTAVMADVAIGDSLQVSASATGGDGAAGATFSRVYVFAHRLVGSTYDFLELATSDATRPTLTLSPGHLLYLADGRRLPAARVVPGDRLQPAEPLAPPASSVGGGWPMGRPRVAWARRRRPLRRGQ